MSLLMRLTSLARQGWDPAFRSTPSLNRAVEHLVGGISTMGRRTISRTIAAMGRDQQDWSADYKLFSRSQWQTNDLYAPILQKALPLTGSGPLAVALDDTKLKKTGRSIPGVNGCRKARDPGDEPLFLRVFRHQRATCFPERIRGICRRDTRCSLVGAGFHADIWRAV